MADLNLTLEPLGGITLHVHGASEQRLSIGMPYIDGGIYYNGEYEATPTWGEQAFATSGKKMRSDFAVHPINEMEIPNESGGLTLTI